MAKLADTLRTLFFLLLILQFAPILIKNIMSQYSAILEPHTKVGALAIKGTLSSSSYYVNALRKLFEHDDIKAILLYIECPGGAAGTAEAIAHEIELLKKEHPKPIITLTENTCASGGYYIAATTDYIVAAPSCLIGSIGTYIPYQFKLKEFIEQFKIKYEAIQAGDYKLVTDPFVNINAEQKEALKALAQSSYDNFVAHVVGCRPQLSLDTQDNWANGKPFTGIQAFKLHLVDQLGSYSDALKKLRDSALIEGKIEWVKPEKKRSLWDFFTDQQQIPDSDNDILSQATPTRETLGQLCYFVLDICGTLFGCCTTDKSLQ